MRLPYQRGEQNDRKCVQALSSRNLAANLACCHLETTIHIDVIPSQFKIALSRFELI